MALPQDEESFLSGKYNPLPPLSGNDSGAFLGRYKKIIDDCRKVNRHNKFFPMIPFALRNTWQSSFYKGLESAARLQKAEGGDVCFFSPEWFLWCVKKFGAEADAEDIKKARRDLGKLRFYRFGMAWQGMRFALSRKAPKSVNYKNSDLMICSVWTQAGCKVWAESGRDPLHGLLPLKIKERKQRPLLVYHAEDKSVQGEASGLISPLNISSLLNFLDWFFLAAILFLFRWRVPESYEYPAEAARRDIETSVSNQLPLALVSYFAAKRFAKVNPAADFIIPYENNCWEQGILLGARESKRKVTGFQHTAFSPSFLKMDNHIEGKLLPDMIFAGGEEAARMLNVLMGIEKERIKVGCSLRRETSRSPVKVQGGEKILVLLQGSPEDSLFLYSLSCHLGWENVLVRAHPSWPVSDAFGFSFSNKALYSDLEEAAVALYTGTTASFDALDAGVPVIHIDLGGALSSDPLFELKGCSVKAEWSGKDDLKRMISRLSALSADERNRGLKVAHQYIDRYFHPADSVTIENILENIAHERL